MSQVTQRRELGRGERVLPGVWRLRLPLPWPGVPHCNAWAVAAGDGVVLFDTGMHLPGSMANLERAMAMVGLRLENVRLVACTHAHADHFGQAASIMQRTGCELWMHPNHGHMTSAITDPEAALVRRLEVARQSGVPEAPLRRYASERRESDFGVAGPVEPARDLVDGVIVDSDLGPWRTVQTPGHAPSHVCFFQPERRLLISGDHLLGRVSLYFDYGYTPDPVGEFLTSLDAVEALDARLCLSGHGRTFTDVQAHIDANRRLVAERVSATRQALGAEAAQTAFEIAPRVFGTELTEVNAQWLLSETLCFLRHLEVAGEAERVVDGEHERWRAAGAGAGALDRDGRGGPAAVPTGT